ncbi:MAG: hypothetical protein JAY91_10275, partial [Candidatus Thiodiazotropha endolucinida]|nr:hypothetical protein [Candidatus Thiodiazotropha taylori]MCW4241266.1 hypothetical protein [Candidatus Thiodiazotropha taylori]
IRILFDILRVGVLVILVIPSTDKSSNSSGYHSLMGSPNGNKEKYYGDGRVWILAYTKRTR